MRVFFFAEHLQNNKTIIIFTETKSQMATREQSLKWWRNLSETTKKFLAEKHIPHQKFTTYNNIDQMYLYYQALKEAIQ